MTKPTYGILNVVHVYLKRIFGMKTINNNNKNNYKHIWKVDFTFLDFQEFPSQSTLGWKVLKGKMIYFRRGEVKKEEISK